MAYENNPILTGQSPTPNSADRAMERYVELIAKRIEAMSADDAKSWQKPWFTKDIMMPRNLDGRKYNGMNSFILMLHAMENGYKLPVFMTHARLAMLNESYEEKKAKGGKGKGKNKGKGEVKEKKPYTLPFVHVNKGEKSIPVILSIPYYKEIDTGKVITADKWNDLTKEEQSRYTFLPLNRVYNVFNIDQSNLAEARPELYAKLVEQCSKPALGEGDELIPAVDKMIADDLWICPIASEYQDRAFYRTKANNIMVPEKGQFADSTRFYSTLFHEMAHSTGAAGVLDRKISNGFGDAEYAREELVAELTSAVVCQNYGLSRGVDEDNAKYLKGWLEAINGDPAYLKTTLKDVTRATRVVAGRTDAVAEQMSRGEKADYAAIRKENAAYRAATDKANGKTDGEEKVAARAMPDAGISEGREKTWYCNCNMDGPKLYKLLGEPARRGDATSMLKIAATADDNKGVYLYETYNSARNALAYLPEYVHVCEDSKHLIAYSNMIHRVFRKVPESAVRAEIERNRLRTLPNAGTADVRALERKMAEEKVKPMLGTHTIGGKTISVRYNRELGTLSAHEMMAHGEEREATVDCRTCNVSDTYKRLMESVKEWCNTDSKWNTITEANVTAGKEKEYYASVAYLCEACYTIDLDVMADMKDYDGILAYAVGCDNGNAIELRRTFNGSSPGLERSKILCENDNYAVMGSGFGSYEIFRKVSEQEIRRAIDGYGIDEDATDEVIEIAKDMAEDSLREESYAQTINTNGHKLQVSYDRDDDVLYAGQATTPYGVPQREVEVKYNHNYTFDTNYQKLYEKVEESPQYAEEQDLEEEQEETRGRGR